MDLTTPIPLSIQTLCEQGVATPWTPEMAPVIYPPRHTDSEYLQSDFSSPKESDSNISPDKPANSLFLEAPPAFSSEKNRSALSAGYRLTPNSAEAAAQLLHWASESKQPLTLRADEGTLLNTPIWLDLQGLKQVRHYNANDFVIQVESGLTVGELDTILAAQGQTLPLYYPHETRLIDLLAEERPTLETGLRGVLRDYVLKTEIATPNGQVTVSGSDVVKSVTGYDLHKLYVGSQNAFGVITAVTLKLTARPDTRQAWCIAFLDFSSAQAYTTTLLQRPFPWSACEIFHSGEQWFVWLEIAGHSSLISEAEALLGTFAASFEHTDPSHASTTASPFRQWPFGATIIEAALPLGHWPAFCQQTLLNEQMAHWRYQIRPAAGLVYLIAPSETCDIRQPSFQRILQELQRQAERLHGFVQIIQTQLQPIQSDDTQDAAGPYRADTPALLRTLAEVNIPRDKTVRDLLKTLKQSYDPNGCLLTPYLPL